MADDERARLTGRIASLKRLFEGFTDGRARAAIIKEITKHEKRVAELDIISETESPEEPMVKRPGDIVT